MPGSYFESLGTTTAAAAAVGFTVMSEETTDEGTVIQVVPADISIVNGGLMVTLDNVSYSTNKIRVYNEPDEGMRVVSTSVVGGNQTNDSSMVFRYTMDRVVTDLDTYDFEFGPGTTATGCVFDSVSIENVTVSVFVVGCGESGNVQLLLKDNSLQFDSVFGPATAVASEVVTIDRIRPSVIRFNSTERSPSKKTSIQYTLQFDESVEDLSSADFVNAGTATGCRFTPNSSSGTTFTVTITRCSTTGTLKPRLINSGVVDSAGNNPLNPWVQSSVTVKLDRVAPQLVFTAVTPKQTTLRQLTFTVRGRSATEEIKCSTISAADFVISKGRFVSVRTQGNKCLVTIASTVATTTTGTTQVAKSRGINITDTAGNRHAGLSGLSLNWTLLR